MSDADDVATIKPRAEWPAGWRKRLDDYLESVDRQPFEWGKFDCALFAAGAIEAMAGVDFAKDFRGTYSDQVGAEAAVAAAGFADYAALVASKLPEAELGTGRIGDIAVVDAPRIGPCLAVIGGAHLTCMTLRGRGNLPLTRASRIFKVG